MALSVSLSGKDVLTFADWASDRIISPFSMTSRTLFQGRLSVENHPLVVELDAAVRETSARSNLIVPRFQAKLLDPTHEALAKELV